MADYKKEFIRFMAECGVLKFGDFVTKSGRNTPYFINTGEYKTGEQLAKLGGFYAQCIKENGIEVETLFGPAYKGIPLSVACAIALSNNYGINVNYCFDRKEAKDHGEGGVIVGKKLVNGEKVCIIEDVITAGTAIRQLLLTLRSPVWLSRLTVWKKVRTSCPQFRKYTTSSASKYSRSLPSWTSSRQSKTAPLQVSSTSIK